MTTTQPTCPNCRHPMSRREIAAMLGSFTSAKKAASSRANGKLGGWPKGRKRGKPAGK